MAKVKCRFCENKNDKDRMTVVENETKSGNITRKYYCIECKKLVDSREEAIEKFYKYTESLVPKKTVYMAFKKMKEKGLNEHDILYTVEYIDRNDMVLNYPMGLLYYIDRAMKDKKKKVQAEENKKRILSKNDKPVIIKVENKKIKSKTDSMDISDFIDEE